MTYALSGTIQSGSYTMDEEQPPWVKDFVAKYGKQVTAMRARFGTYPGAPLIFAYNAKSTVPVTNPINAWALADYWTRLGDDMLRQALEDFKKTLSARAYQAAERLAPLVAKFKKDVSTIGISSAFIGFSNEQSMATKLWQLIRAHAQALSFAMWSGYNIETSFELAVWSVKESAKALGKTLAKPFIEVLEAGDLLWKVVKWGTVGTVALAFAWGASKIIKRRKA